MLLGAAAGFGFFLVSLVVVGAVGGAVAFLAGWLHAEVLPEGDVLGSAAYAWAIVCVALGVWAAAYALVRDRLSVDDVGLGAAAVLVALAIAAFFQVPGTSYLFLWPSLGCATCAASRREGAGPTAMASLAAVACSLPAVLIVVPLLHGAYEGLGVSVGGGVLMGILVGLLAGSLAAPLESLRSFASARSLVASPLVVGLALFGLGMAGTRTSVEHPKASQLWYVLDAGTSRARWASSAARSDAWTAELVGTHPARAPLFPGLSRMWLQGDAVAVATAAPPELTVVEAADAAGGRTFRIEARAGRAGALDFETLSPVVEATVEGKAVPPRSAGGAWRLTYLDVGEAGITLALRVRGRGPMTLSVTERLAGVPVMAGKSARPPWSVPQHDGDQTVIRRDFVL